MNLKKEKLKQECRSITACILKGMTNNEIAKKLNYSRSTIVYKINKLFKKYNSKNRFEFAIAILTESIEEKKKEIEFEQLKTRYHFLEARKAKKILKKIIENYEDEKEIKRLVRELKKKSNVFEE